MSRLLSPSRCQLTLHRPVASAIALASALVALPACSMLGLGTRDSGTKDLVQAPGKKSAASAKDAHQKTDPPTSEQLQSSSSDLQRMFDEMEKVHATKAAVTSGPAGPVEASGTAPSASSASASGVLESSRLAPAPQPPVLVASTRAVASESLPELGLQPPTTEAKALAAPSPPPVAASLPTAPSVKPSGVSATESSLTIAAAALCSRVESFGRYSPLNSSTFLAGRPAQMILYTELGGFSQKPLESDANQFVTELGQSVELYLDADGSRQFVIPRQTIREATRSQRKDFYLVQRVTLPGNLSVGKYNLKVRVIDIASGQESERSIPIQIAADPASARTGTSENRATTSAATTR